jgi:multiple sugar transport system substrate-binding protein
MAAALAGCGGPADSGTTTISFAWWGGDVEADLTYKAIEAFEAANSDIKVNGSFLDWPSYWQKRSTEAAGGGLPDVMAFDISYIREYSSRGILLDLAQLEQVGLDTAEIDENLMATGQVDGVQYGIPTSTNSWSLLYNQDELDNLGIDLPSAPYTWDEYDEFLIDVREASGGALYGGPDYTYRMQNFEVVLRQEGSYLITPEGKLGFDKARLAAFWERGNALRAQDAVVPQRTVEQIQPKFPVGSVTSATEFLWEEMSIPQAGDAGVAMLGIAPPPSDTAESGVYVKAARLLSVNAKTKEKAAAARFVSWMLNDPGAADIGLAFGIPSSSKQIAGVTLTAPQQNLLDYHNSMLPKAMTPPPAPVAGYGTLESEFLRLAQEVAFGKAISVAVDEWFSGADKILNG